MFHGAFWLGVVSGVVATIIAAAANRTRLTLLKWYRRITGKIRPIPPSPVTEKMNLKVGDLDIDWVILEYAEYLPGRFITRYDDSPIDLPQDIQKIYDEYYEEQMRLDELNQHRPFNGLQYKLKSFHYDRRVDNELGHLQEVPLLHLNFGPTDYYMQKVTDFNQSNETVAKYAAGFDILSNETIPEFATILGVNINIITSDHYLIVTRRGLSNHETPGKYHTSVAENMLRPFDGGTTGNPDPFLSGVRGAQEELGIELSVSDITYTAFGVNPKTFQYSLIGWAQTPLTFADVVDLRILGVPKDKRENDGIYALPFKPDDVAQYVYLRLGQWNTVGLASVVLSLFQIPDLFSRNEVIKAFHKGAAKN